ncbi:MAG: dihydropteroate synthase [Planctomycetes bacterium]|nr:dihydropteroate synthase [Planctomycetota bacterium]
MSFAPRPRFSVPCGATVLELGARTAILGIVNVTPDSFSDGGRFVDPEAAVAHGLALLGEGAHALDVGGESTRPGAAPVAAEEEERRVLPVIRALARQTRAPISVDTTKARVAAAALDAGAVIVNDVSAGLDDPEMLPTVARGAAALVLKHRQGTSATMQVAPRYDDVVGEVRDHLAGRLRAALAAGIAAARLLVDPGIGFGKTLEHNLEILRRLEAFHALGRPLLVGPSRKNFLGRILDLPPDQRVEGTAAAVALAIAAGAHVVRVHDVRAIARVARVADAIVADAGGDSAG